MNASVWVALLGFLAIACPALHFFMHRGHGRHGRREDESHR